LMYMQTNQERTTRLANAPVPKLQRFVGMRAGKTN
jgi:hypothetical protein